MKLIKFKKFISVSVIFTLTLFNTFGQESWLKVLDNDASQASYQIEIHQNQFYILTGKIFNNTDQGSVVTQLNEEGEVNWSVNVPWIDCSPKAMHFMENSIFLFGNDNSDQSHFFMHEMSASNGDSIEMTIIDHSSLDLNNMHHIASARLNEKFMVAGSARNIDMGYSIIYVVDPISKVTDTLLIPSQSNLDSFIWDLNESIDGNLIVSIMEETIEGDNIRKILKIDSNYNTIWNYTSEHDFYNRSFPYTTELEDNRIAFTIGHTTTNTILHSIRAVNNDGSISWQFDHPISFDQLREIRHLKLAANGDILGCGIYANFAEDPVVNRVPYLFRMTSEGEMLWERAYIDLDLHGEAKWGVFSDVKELADGSLILLGQIQNENDDILLMKVGADGCLTENCNELQLITATSKIERDQRFINIFPNPTFEQIYIDTDISLRSIDIYNIYGQLVKSYEHEKKIDLSFLSPGLYLIQLIDLSDKSITQRIIIK